ncbi:hypothetical protein BK133_04340 [Paenibacillus sp. FSL H8-0548]|uniref:hypothetical protein n=1 Tax=Paenibacillus sp. FSL H8-0548 TaxID=1920422 RepID=UPI00096D0C95|nr:hypothetical protein [Paenibacillus sp. FSL H8-0548]OMF37771.1 hypothetical protein BK133_04340 [Paenibacillus sp. FSL H8-0548]
MNKKIWNCTLLSFVLILALTACSKTESTDNIPSVKDDEAAIQTEVIDAVEDDAADVDDPEHRLTEKVDNGKVPAYLPKDFPLPEDALIVTSHAEETDGKKSVLLIFTTEESMATVSKLYKDYFIAQNLENVGQTVDNKNIIIQGENKETEQNWSMIGGPLASKEGVIELTVTWSEM